jgi:hypothetical protein
LVLVGLGGFWRFLVGSAGFWWVLVSSGGFWWVLVGSGCFLLCSGVLWWALVGHGFIEFKGSPPHEPYGFIVSSELTAHRIHGVLRAHRVHRVRPHPVNLMCSDGFGRLWWVLVGSSWFWRVLVGSAGFCWVLVGSGGFWYVLAGSLVVLCWFFWGLRMVLGCSCVVWDCSVIVLG